MHVVKLHQLGWSDQKPSTSLIILGWILQPINILVKAPWDADVYAIAGFWSTQHNLSYQLGLLDALHSLPTDTFKFVSLPGHQIVMMDNVASTSPTIKALAANVQGLIQNSLDLFEVCLADSEQAKVRGFIWEMLDKAACIIL